MKVEVLLLTTFNIYEGGSTFFNEVVNHAPNFNNLDDLSKFTFLMSQENKLITKLLVPKYISGLNNRSIYNIAFLDCQMVQHKQIII